MAIDYNRDLAIPELSIESLASDIDLLVDRLEASFKAHDVIDQSFADDLHKLRSRAEHLFG
jgi:hypothetical protein